MENNKSKLKDFLKEDFERMIQEAKHMALHNLKERLVPYFENIFWEEAQKQIEAVVINTHEVREKNISLQEENIGIILQENKRVYLFGITDVEAERYINQSGLAGMVNEDRVYSFIYKEIAAVVCQVPQEEFNELKIQEFMENSEWLEKKADRHQKVVSFLAKRYPVVPMRFSSLYPAHHQLKIFMEENYRDLIGLLNKIRDKNEWGLKIYLNEESFKRFLQEKDESINNLMDEVLLNQVGKGYLPQKRLANKIERKAFDLAEEVHRRLCRFSSSAVLNKLVPKDDTGKRGQMILNGAYLVARTQVEEFMQVVKWLEEIEGPRGFTFEISGPRPCYNFCSISSTGT